MAQTAGNYIRKLHFGNLMGGVGSNPMAVVGIVDYNLKKNSLGVI